MSTKEDILNNIRKNIKHTYDMPDLNITGIQYTDKLKQFIEISKFVGGEAIELNEGENINDIIKSRYPKAQNIASNIIDITIANINPDNIADPHELSNLDLSVINGEIGVAENGCVWIPQNVRQKVVYFISEYLVIILDKKNIVNNMHEAYAKLETNEKGFGVFISGPSKTADIEQSLVIGAHGAKGVTIILK